MVADKERTPSPGFASKWFDVSRFGFWKSALAVYLIFCLCIWAASRFNPQWLPRLPLLGFAFFSGMPFVIFLMPGLLPGNLLTNLGVLDHPHMLLDWVWIGGFWLVFIFLLIRVLFYKGRKKWLYLALLLLFLMLSMYNFLAYFPTSM